VTREVKEKFMKLFQQGMALFLSWSLVLMCGQNGFAYQADPATSQPPPQAAQQPPPQAAQQSSEQLQELVAPIALYPDTLIAQILGAATYPDQVVEAGKETTKNRVIS
jgi:hypothetical protein